MGLDREVVQNDRVFPATTQRPETKHDVASWSAYGDELLKEAVGIAQHDSFPAFEEIPPAVIKSHAASKIKASVTNSLKVSITMPAFPTDGLYRLRIGLCR